MVANGVPLTSGKVMRRRIPRPRILTFTTIVMAAGALAACSGGASSPNTGGSPSTSAALHPTPAASRSNSASASASAPAKPSASASATATDSASARASAPPAAARATVVAKPVGGIGTVLVAGSNGRTIYVFAQDVKGSGKSNCTGGCLATWPALTVASGATLTRGPGVMGALGVITRSDNGTRQVTYNGLPLYFFSGDSAAGDANGVYPNWAAVKP
jgi:predicted lipoprotein with Yx(FWY)xxD motif